MAAEAGILLCLGHRDSLSSLLGSSACSCQSCQTRSRVLGGTRLPRMMWSLAGGKETLRELPWACLVLVKCWEQSVSWGCSFLATSCINFQQSHTVIITNSVEAATSQHPELNLWLVGYHQNHSCGTGRQKPFYYLLFHLLLFAL